MLVLGYGGHRALTDVSPANDCEAPVPCEKGASSGEASRWAPMWKEPTSVKHPERTLDPNRTGSGGWDFLV